MVYLNECSITLGEKCIFFCWVNHFINVNYDYFVDSVQVSYTITNFLVYFSSQLLRRLLKSPIIILDLLTCFTYVYFGFICFDAPLLGTYTFRVLMSSWGIDHHDLMFHFIPDNILSFGHAY